LEPRLRAVVEAKLALRWSPEQIAGWLPLAYPSDPVMRVSHETIYLSLFIQSRGALRRELQRCLRSGRAMRYPRAKRLPQGRGQLRDILHISQRPPEAADRAVPGHWEGDLVFGKRPSAVGTLVERHSRYVLLFPLPEGVTAHQVRPALTAAVLGLPEQLRRSLTWDQGREMAEHLQFTIDSGVQVYFCDPRSPWQRGTGGVNFDWPHRGGLKWPQRSGEEPVCRRSWRLAPEDAGGVAVELCEQVVDSVRRCE
jgi:transposase, IS30 family